jgi:hypothetical protein
MIVILVLSTPLTGLALAQVADYEEELVDEIAAQLEFIFEEAVVWDENRNIIDIDVDKIEQQFGSSRELREIKRELNKMKRQNNKNNIRLESFNDPYTIGIMSHGNDALDRCIERRIINGFSEIFYLTGMTTLVHYLQGGKYILAAKEVVKLGVKSNVVGVSLTLSWYYISCMNEVG